MPKSIPEQALVVVADGGKATFYRRTGSGADVTLHEEQSLTPKTLAAEGPAGSRPEDQSPKQTDAASFANHLAHMLYAMHQRHEFQDVILVASPQTLGQLRAALHKTVEAAVFDTVAKDFTNHSRKAIEAALAG